VEPPSSEGIDEEPPLPLFAGEDGGSANTTAAAAAAMIEQETEHGPELEAGDGESDAPEVPNDGVDPVADTNEAR